MWRFRQFAMRSSHNPLHGAVRMVAQPTVRAGQNVVSAPYADSKARIDGESRTVPSKSRLYCHGQFDSGIEPKRDWKRGPFGLAAGLLLLACLAPAFAADMKAPLVTLKSGRTYRVYGDILVPVEVSPGSTLAFSGTRWPQANVFYAFDPSVDAVQQASFRQWVTQWQSVSGVQFVESAGAVNRILVQSADDSGCGHSSLGMIGGVQDLVIACWTSDVVLHELGHALGMIHEQQRADRNSFVSFTDHGIAAVCGQAFWEAQFGIIGTDTASSYDYASIMHYPAQSHFTCNDQDVYADITALQAQPPGAPAGSENVCTSAAACQGVMGASALSVRDGYGLALRYGYRITLALVGNGGGSVTIAGDREACGGTCWLVAPTSTFIATANPYSDSVATFSGACNGQTCQFQPMANGFVQVRFTKKSSVVAVIAAAARLDDEAIFKDGFDTAL